MANRNSSNAAVAKIHTIHGKMFTSDSYREMLTKRNIPELAEYLFKSPRFKGAFEGTDPNTIHRGYLEELIGRENFRVYMRLCSFQALGKKPFYQFLIRKREVLTLLGFLNRLDTSPEDLGTGELPGYLIKNSPLKLLELSRAESYEEFLRLLKGTHYYKILSKIPLKEDGKADYTECELRLRTDYYNTLMEQAQKDFPSSAAELRQLIAKEIGFLNFINAYRMKAYFGFSSEQIKRRSIFVEGMSKKRMEEYYASPTVEQMEKMLRKHLKLSENESLDNIETAVNRVKYAQLCHLLARTNSAPAALYTFVQLCDIETANIVHIIEGIRYGADRTLIENQLIYAN